MTAAEMSSNNFQCLGLPKIFFFWCVVMCMFPSIAFSQDYAGKKILYVDSYHEGYAWSDGITEGVKSTLANTGIELKIVRMNTKVKRTEAQIAQAALDAKSAIEAFRPDVLIASDDNASKYLVVPYYKDSDLPVVFCGLNWDATNYGYPFKNTTGMVEVNDIAGLVDVMKQFAKGDRIGFIGGDTLTNRKEAEYYKKIFSIDVVPYYPKDFAEWKSDYVDAQSKTDMLVFYNFVAIENWDRAEAISFIEKNTKIPSGTFQEGPMPYVVIGYLKVAQEQGIWAAKVALEILDGKSPSEIPIAQNEQGLLKLNLKLAQKSGMEIPYDIIEAANEVYE